MPPGDLGAAVAPHLAAIEQEEDIDILAAWVVGSHAWNLDGPDSDIDLAVTYLQPRANHAMLTHEVETLDASEDDIADLLPDEARGDVELDGWDAQRFLQLLVENNPVAIECLLSPHAVRGGEALNRLEAHVAERFNPIELFQHHQSMAKRNHRKYLASGSRNTVKKTLTVLRACLSAEYIRATHDLPPADFDTLVSEVPDDSVIDWDTEAIREFAERKRAGDGDAPAGTTFHDSIERFIEFTLDFEAHIPDESIDSAVLDECMLDLIEEWREGSWTPDPETVLAENQTADEL